MRWIWAFAALAALAACEEGGEAPGQTLDAATGAAVEVVEETPQFLLPDGEVPVIGESRLELLRASCTAKGGRFRAVGNGHICFTETPDAGEFCSVSTDCTTECLARTRTCAPLSPLLGCHEIFTATGAIVTQCREL